MRTSLRRALAGVSALTLMSAALVLGGTGTASAEDSNFCPHLGSTRLLTANDGAYKVWLYQPSGETHLCFGVDGHVRGDLLLRTGLTGSLIPTVVPDVDDDECGVYFHLQDPVDVEINLGVDTSPPTYEVCFGGGGTAVGLSYTPASGSLSPSPELWLDNSLVARAYCTRIYGSSAACAYPIRFL